MTVKELISKLQKCPENATVKISVHTNITINIENSNQQPPIFGGFIGGEVYGVDSVEYGDYAIATITGS
jgi:hypothetical protein